MKTKIIYLLIIALNCSIFLNAAEVERKISKLMIINNMFFEQKPEPIPCGIDFEIGFVKDKSLGKITVINYNGMSDEAKEFAIPTEKIKDAERVLKLAKEANMIEMKTSCPELEIKEGDKMPEFDLKNNNGKKWDNQSIKGRKTVINFWFTGCGSCIKEMPELSRLKEKYPENIYLAVTFNSADEISEVVSRQGFNYIQLVDADSLIKAIGVKQYPLTLVVNEAGIITYVQNGTSPVQMKHLEKEIAE